MTEESERIPVHEDIEVKESKTLFKTDGWWKAVSYQNSFGNDEIAIYLWKKSDSGNWGRKQKATLKEKEDWEEMKSAVEDLIENLE